jgi:hypothetical protein
MVSSAQAAYWGRAFLDRFDALVQQQPAIRSPWDGVEVRVRDWPSCRREEPALLPPSQGGSPVVPFGRPALSLPTPRAVVYSIHPPKGHPFALAALFFCRTAAYAAQGFDPSPATLEGLLRLLERAVAFLSLRRLFLVLGLASPTGWDQEAEAVVTGSEGALPYTHPRLALCLVDGFRNRLIHNPLDPRLRPYLSLFAGETEGEQVERVRRFIREAMADRLGVTAREVREALRVDEDTVRLAFSLLASEGLGEPERREGTGLVFLKRI